MEIRKACESDIGAIRDLFDKNYRKDYFLPTTHIRRAVTGEVEARFGKQRQPHHVYVAYESDTLVGMALVNRSGCLNNILIHKDYRGLGIGSQLLVIAQPKTIRCKTDNSDGDPTYFYKKHGYMEFGQYDLWGDLPLVGKRHNIRLLKRANLTP